MKVRLLFSKLFGYFLIIYVVVAILIFCLFLSYFLMPWSIAQPLVIGIYTFLMLAFYIIVYRTSFYVITKKYVSFHKLGKEQIYYFSEIVYIDQKETEKNKVISFCTKYGDARYLIFDQKKVLYPTMLENCKNCLSYEDFKKKFPKVKI